MYEQHDIIFIILDKMIELMDKIYFYYNPVEERRVNIELGNLYTIKEEDEEEDCFKDNYIFDEFILV